MLTLLRTNRTNLLGFDAPEEVAELVAAVERRKPGVVGDHVPRHDHGLLPGEDGTSSEEQRELSGSLGGERVEFPRHRTRLSRLLDNMERGEPQSSCSESESCGEMTMNVDDDTESSEASSAAQDELQRLRADQVGRAVEFLRGQVPPGPAPASTKAAQEQADTLLLDKRIPPPAAALETLVAHANACFLEGTSMRFVVGRVEDVLDPHDNSSAATEFSSPLYTVCLLRGTTRSSVISRSPPTSTMSEDHERQQESSSSEPVQPPPSVLHIFPAIKAFEQHVALLEAERAANVDADTVAASPTADHEVSTFIGSLLTGGLVDKCDSLGEKLQKALESLSAQNTALREAWQEVAAAKERMARHDAGTQEKEGTMANGGGTMPREGSCEEELLDEVRGGRADREQTGVVGKQEPMAIAEEQSSDESEESSGWRMEDDREDGPREDEARSPGPSREGPVPREGPRSRDGVVETALSAPPAPPGEEPTPADRLSLAEDERLDPTVPVSVTDEHRVFPPAEMECNFSPPIGNNIGTQDEAGARRKDDSEGIDVVILPAGPDLEDGGDRQMQHDRPMASLIETVFEECSVTEKSHLPTEDDILLPALKMTLPYDSDKDVESSPECEDKEGEDEERGPRSDEEGGDNFSAQGITAKGQQGEKFETPSHPHGETRTTRTFYCTVHVIKFCDKSKFVFLRVFEFNVGASSSSLWSSCPVAVRMGVG